MSRFVIPRYPNKSVVLGADIFPVDKGDPKVAVQAATVEVKPAEEKSFWTTPFGATLAIGSVVGGLYYLGKNMGVE